LDETNISVGTDKTPAFYAAAAAFARFVELMDKNDKEASPLIDKAAVPLFIKPADTGKDDENNDHRL
jgi:hypothetical protein